jgi:hypothetical protein
MTAKKPGLRARSSSVQAALVAAKGEDHVTSTAADPAPTSTAPAPSRTKPVVLSARLPPEMHEELRTIAFERRVSIHALLMEGVETVLKKYRKR